MDSSMVGIGYCTYTTVFFSVAGQMDNLLLVLWAFEILPKN